MPYVIACPFCGQQYTVANEQFGSYVNSEVTCSACQRPFSVIQDGPNLRAIAPAQPVHASPPPIGGYAPPAPTGRSNGFAIAGLVSGIIAVCTCGLTCGLANLLGIIFSIIGLQRSKTTGSGKGVAIAGLIISIVSLAILPAVLIPALSRAREKANQIKCAQNLRLIGQAMAIYADSNRGIYPPTLDELKPILTSTTVFTCPSDNSPSQISGSTTTSYIYVAANQRLAKLGPEAVLLYEPLSLHRNEGSNFLFSDGHVQFLGAKDAIPMIRQLEQGTNPPKSGNSPAAPDNSVE